MSLDVLSISQITITKTSELVLSPTSLSLTCGTTTPQTFTVSNPNNVQNITSYEWNLGSSGNGWLYNGSAAPQNISTTTNSITLTPNCGSSLSNVSVTVRVNNQDYKTYSCAVSTTSPAMSINGITSFCSGSHSYTVNGLPCNANVTWSVSPSGIASLSCSSCNSTTLTKTGNGTITLTASVSSCGGTQPVTTGIQVGALQPASPYMYFNGVAYTNGTTNLCLSKINTYTVSIDPVEGATSYNWSIGAPNAVSLISGQGTNEINVSVFGPLHSSLTFAVQPVNSCGTGAPIQVDGHICSVGGDDFFVISPNPASTTLQIQSTDKTRTIKEVRIADKINVIRKRLVRSAATTSLSINISDLPTDVYYVQIFDGSSWSTIILSKK